MESAGRNNGNWTPAAIGDGLATCLGLGVPLAMLRRERTAKLQNRAASVSRTARGSAG
jgi:hypothetical protein